MLHKKYPTRYQIKKVENAVDRLRLVFKAVDNFVNMEHEEEVKEALVQELRFWEDGEEGVKKKMAEMLKKHLIGEELDEQTAVENTRLDEIATPLKTATLLTASTPLTTARLNTPAQMKTPETLKTATPLETAKTPNETIHDILRRKTMKFSVRPSATPTPSSSVTSQFSGSTPPSFLSRRASSSSIGLAQMILRRSSLLDQSVICLGSVTKKKSSIETVILDSSLNTTPSKTPVNPNESYENRLSEPMSMSSPQSPWPKTWAKPTNKRPE